MSGEAASFSKDEIIKLHRLVWKIKENLESSGLKFDLSEYEDFDVYAWRLRVSSKEHWYAISLLAKELSREAVRAIRLKM